MDQCNQLCSSVQLAWLVAGCPSVLHAQRTLTLDIMHKLLNEIFSIAAMLKRVVHGSTSRKKSG